MDAEHRAAAALHLAVWTGVLLGHWQVVPGALLVRWAFGGGALGTAALRAALVQGTVAVWAMVLRAHLPPVAAWLEPIPWIDVVRVSGMWVPTEAGWRGGWTWAAQATLGLCAVTSLAAPALLAGPWLAWTSAWTAHEPRASARPLLGALAAWTLLGLLGWALLMVLAAAVPADLGHQLVRACSWAWLGWSWVLGGGAGVLPLALLAQAGWVRWPVRDR